MEPVEKDKWKWDKIILAILFFFSFFTFIAFKIDGTGALRPAVNGTVLLLVIGGLIAMVRFIIRALKNKGGSSNEN